MACKCNNTWYLVTRSMLFILLNNLFLWQTTTAKVVDLGPWKELTDESTNYLYYWNIETNEVSWTLPECLSKSTLPVDDKSAQKVEIKLKSDKIG